eukprot:scaffold259_cov252-Pinguiococcus_pyrenoidosus.AAC.27
MAQLSHSARAFGAPQVRIPISAPSPEWPRFPRIDSVDSKRDSLDCLACTCAAATTCFRVGCAAPLKQAKQKRQGACTGCQAKASLLVAFVRLGGQLLRSFASSCHFDLMHA